MENSQNYGSRRRDQILITTKKRSEIMELIKEIHINGLDLLLMGVIAYLLGQVHNLKNEVKK